MQLKWENPLRTNLAHHQFLPAPHAWMLINYSQQLAVEISMKWISCVSIGSREQGSSSLSRDSVHPPEFLPGGGTTIIPTVGNILLLITKDSTRMDIQFWKWENVKHERISAMEEYHLTWIGQCDSLAIRLSCRESREWPQSLACCTWRTIQSAFTPSLSNIKTINLGHNRQFDSILDSVAFPPKQACQPRSHSYKSREFADE